MSVPNLALRFTLELCLLAALGFWGAHFGTSWIVSVSLAVMAPLSAAIVWGLFVSPKARIRTSTATRLGMELGVFAAGICGLAMAGRTRWALAFAMALMLHELWRAAESRGAR